MERRRLTCRLVHGQPADDRGLFSSEFHPSFKVWELSLPAGLRAKTKSGG